MEHSGLDSACPAGIEAAKSAPDLNVRPISRHAVDSDIPPSSEILQLPTMHKSRTRRFYMATPEPSVGGMCLALMLIEATCMPTMLSAPA